MKITNGEIFAAREPIQTLMDIKLPVKTSFAVAKLANKLNDKLRAIDDVRNGLVKKYGEADKDNPQQIGVKPESENFIPFVNDMNELFAEEEELVFDKVVLPEKVAATCDKCNHNMDRDLEIEPRILMALEKFISIK